MPGQDPDGSSSLRFPDFTTINEAGTFHGRLKVYDFTNKTVHSPLFSKLKYIFEISCFRHRASNISVLVERYVKNQFKLCNVPEEPISLKYIFQNTSSDCK